MKFLSMLGADKVFTTWDSLFESGGPLYGGTWSWVQSLMNVLTIVMWVALALVGAAGGIYAVYVGIKMARADSAEQRDEIDCHNCCCHRFDYLLQHIFAYDYWRV